MEIRLMSIEDYDEVYRLWKNTEGVGLRSLDDSQEGIRNFLQRNPSTNFIAQENHEIIGVILCGQDGRRGYIYHTTVKENYRGQGVGKALVSAVIAALKKEGINKVALVAFAANESGNKFWESLGFAQRNDLVYRDFNINELNV